MMIIIYKSWVYIWCGSCRELLITNLLRADKCLTCDDTRQHKLCSSSRMINRLAAVTWLVAWYNWLQWGDRWHNTIGCRDMIGCSDMIGWSDTIGCIDAIGCSDTIGWSDVVVCSDVTDCSDTFACSDVIGCRDVIVCSDLIGCSEVIGSLNW